jgi:predicted nuclease of predicted toxin-antitoxin system
VRFLLDESADARIVPHLRSLVHAVTRIAAEYPAGLPDGDVLALAVSEDRVVITSDRDFGEMVVRQRREHRGVILFRLGDYAELELWIERLDYVLTEYEPQSNQLVVVTRRSVRVRTSDG